MKRFRDLGKCLAKREHVAGIPVEITRIRVQLIRLLLNHNLRFVREMLHSYLEKHFEVLSRRFMIYFI